MEKAVADSILPHFFLDSIIIKPLMVNKIRPENLSKHPYINFEKAKAIYEYRRRHIRIRSKEELQKIDALNAEDIKKIEIYLDFSD